jgi:hypothetical protein
MKSLLCIRSITGETALHLAVKSNFPAVVTLLRGFGADVRARCAAGFTPADLLRQQRGKGGGEHLRVALESSAAVDHAILTSFRQFAYEASPLSADAPSAPSSVCAYLHKVQEIFVDKISAAGDDKADMTAAMAVDPKGEEESGFEEEFRETVEQLSGLFRSKKTKAASPLLLDVSACSVRSFCTSTLVPTSSGRNRGKSQKEIFHGCG